MLGPLAVWTDAGVPVPVPGAKVRALLTDLLRYAGRPVPPDRLVADLWGDAAPGNPTAALQAKVSQLRRALGDRDLVRYGPAGYALRLADGELDADRFTAAVAAARQATDPATRAAGLAAALEVWRGEAYADVADEPYARAEIQRLTEARLAATEDLAEARLELGEPVDLADLTAAYPLRERLHELSLRALYRSGRVAEALTSYAGLRARLADELGTDPGPRLVALHRAILRQDPTLDPPRPTGTPLPVPLTALVGRDDAVREVVDRLGAARLVTLTGPGGVGKTRLALAAATALAADVPDGVWLVDLTGTSADPGGVAEAVAAALGVRDAGGGALPDRLAAAVRARRALLVLDNCEHVLAPAAELADHLLRAAPGLRVLATGQAPLGIPGEIRYAVGPLPPADAVRLFVERAAAAGALVDPADPAVAAICARLDGVPLALELAAPRLAAFGPGELAARLDDRFRLLDGRRGTPARHHSLRAMLDWSWDLLADPDRVLLRRLAVTAGGWTLPAAVRIGAGGAVTAADVPGMLAGLVERSLVVAAPDGRYRMLESVAAYATDRLAESGDGPAARLAHREWYLALAERADPLLRGADQRRWLATLDAETPNLRAALDHAVDRGAAADAYRMVRALWWYWFLRGRLGEAHRALSAALAVPATPGTERLAVAAIRAVVAVLLGDGTGLLGPAERAVAALPAGRDRAYAEWFLAMAAVGAGDPAESERRIGRAAAWFEAAGDRWGTAAALTSRASQILPTGDLPGARRAAERSAALFAELGDGWGLIRSGELLASFAEIAGDHARAGELRRRSLRHARELGLTIEESYQVAGLGRLALLAGDLDGSAALHGTAMRLAAEQSHQRGVQFAEVGLGMTARRQGRLDDAERHLTRWLDWCRDLDGHPGTTLILAELGFVAEHRGDASTARARHAESLRYARRTGDPRAVALAYEGLAGAAVLAGDPRHAAELLGAAAYARESVGAPLPPAERGDVDRITAAARAALTPATFTTAYATGTASGAPGAGVAPGSPGPVAAGDGADVPGNSGESASAGASRSPDTTSDTNRASDRIP
ncbi:BTAD domain-containing putative transcriptional regulator [Actinocatenispora rupis]|uniref:SARP family transcriptional regulator n=1 Tax=Actinocatenispora rupis TaxID=519421 RepID=A0A8J3JBH7_9ACTN|nr:SARP family transcriptional regulator [Actinocatenispora rupis]